MSDGRDCPQCGQRMAAFNRVRGWFCLPCRDLEEAELREEYRPAPVVDGYDRHDFLRSVDGQHPSHWGELTAQVKERGYR